MARLSLLKMWGRASIRGAENYSTFLLDLEAMRVRDRDISNSGQQCFEVAKAVKAEMRWLCESSSAGGMKYQVAA